jgi:hypothetical protein
MHAIREHQVNNLNINVRYGEADINDPAQSSGDSIDDDRITTDETNERQQPDVSLNTLTSIFSKLVGGAASDEDRHHFRRAIFKGKIILKPSEKILHLELGDELYWELQEELYPPPPGLLRPLPGSIFLGREKDLLNVKQLLGINSKVSQAGVPAVVRGWPGVGKTAFISALCRDPDIARSFPDGVLWTYLDQEPELFSKLAAWGRTLTGTDELLRVPTLNEAAARLAELLRRRRMLLVVDDVWDVAQAVPFLQAGNNGQCALLMTTRLPHVADEIAKDPQRVYTLPVLAEESALLLLHHLIPTVVEQHQDLSHELAHDLEYLPLSLHVASRLLRRYTELGLDIVNSINEIRRGGIMRESVPADMAMAFGSRLSLQTLLERSTNRLDEHTRECFAFLGAFAPEPAIFDLAATQAVWQVPDAKPIVRKLVGLGLLEPIGNRRFQMHALLVQLARTFLT